MLWLPTSFLILHSDRKHERNCRRCPSPHFQVWWETFAFQIRGGCPFASSKSSISFIGHSFVQATTKGGPRQTNSRTSPSHTARFWEPIFWNRVHPPPVTTPDRTREIWLNESFSLSTSCTNTNDVKSVLYYLTAAPFEYISHCIGTLKENPFVSMFTRRGPSKVSVGKADS